MTFYSVLGLLSFQVCALVVFALFFMESIGVNNKSQQRKEAGLDSRSQDLFDSNLLVETFKN